MAESKRVIAVAQALFAHWVGSEHWDDPEHTAEQRMCVDMAHSAIAAAIAVDNSVRVSSNDKAVEAIARSQCNKLPLEAPDYDYGMRCVGHRFGYRECVAPNCSCWGARLDQVRETIAADDTSLKARQDG